MAVVESANILRSLEVSQEAIKLSLVRQNLADNAHLGYHNTKYQARGTLNVAKYRQTSKNVDNYSQALAQSL